MAYAINQYCTACGDCVVLCPNYAINEAYRSFRINPYLCTECVGYSDQPRCVQVCGAEAIQLAAEPIAAVESNGIRCRTGLKKL